MIAQLERTENISIPSVSTSSQQTGVVMCPVLCYTCGKLNLSRQMQFFCLVLRHHYCVNCDAMSCPPVM